MFPDDVDVPVQVLVPRSRLILTSRLLPAGAHVRLPLGALGGGVVLGGVAGKTPDKTGLPVRRDQQVWCHSAPFSSPGRAQPDCQAHGLEGLAGLAPERPRWLRHPCAAPWPSPTVSPPCPCDSQIVAGARGHGLTGRIVVSAVGPLSPAESAVLDGVVDMELEREARWASIWAYMRAYGVRGSDTFPDFFE